MLTIILALFMVAGAQAAPSNYCLEVKKEPRDMMNYTFVASADDTCGVKFGAYIEFTHRETYLPLKVERLDYRGKLDNDTKSTLILTTDCGKVEIDLSVDVNGDLYAGQSDQVRFYYEGKTYTHSGGLIKFSKYQSDGITGYNCSWGEMKLDGQWFPSMILHFNSVGFIANSRDVTLKYRKRIANQVGYKCAFN